MKTLKFEYDGQPFRVYLDRDGAVFVDVKDLVVSAHGSDLKTYKLYLADYPPAKYVARRPVWAEARFYHIWMDDMAADELMFFYLETVQPAIRSALIQEQKA